MRGVLSVLIVVALATAACGGDDEAEPSANDGFAFTGGDIAEGRPIDPVHTCDGTNVSPELTWEGVPDGAAELALIVDDPDAPGGTFIHWIAYAIPPDYSGLDPGVPPGPVLSGGLTLRQGPSDGSDVPGWFGPCPPEGETHGYVFALYALDEAAGLEGGATADDLRAAMEGHVIAEAMLTAPYARSSR